MRRSRRIRLHDVPRFVLRVVVELAGLFGGRYRRTEGAHALVTDAEGRILVVRTTYLGPGWSLPGGRVERGETPHAAAIRETREETGIEVRLDRLVLVDAFRPETVSFIFTAAAVGGELEPQFGEIAEAGWLDRAELERTSGPLHRLLAQIPVDDTVTYIGLPRRR